MKWPWDREVTALFPHAEIDTDDAILLGQRAERLLNDDIFLHSVEKVVLDIAQDWMREADDEKRRLLWLEQRALARIRRRLGAFVEAGKAEKAARAGERRLTAMNE